MPVVHRSEENKQVAEGEPVPVRVLFMGTPDFALPSLAALVERSAPE